jgi:hypothetical protein
MSDNEGVEGEAGEAALNWDGEVDVLDWSEGEEFSWKGEGVEVG